MASNWKNSPLLRAGGTANVSLSWYPYSQSQFTGHLGGKVYSAVSVSQWSPFTPDGQLPLELMRSSESEAAGIPENTYRLRYNDAR
jgi:hypothetical protein